MSNYLKKAEKINGEVISLLNTINAEERQPTAEERETLTTKQREIDDLTNMAEIEAKAKKTDEYFNKPVGDEPKKQDGAEPKSVWGDNRKVAFGNFLQAVKTACSHGGHVDERLVRNTSGNMEERNADEGGYAIDREFMGEIVDGIYETGIIASKATKDTVGTGKNGATWYANDETSRADGSRFGGMQTYWGDEAASITLTKNKLRKLELSLDKKLMAMILPTFEQLQDRPLLGAQMERMVKAEFGWKMDEAMISGPGGGRPLGVLNSNVIVEVAKESGQLADTVVYENVLNMYSRIMISSMRNAVWYVNQFMLPQLQTMAHVIGAGGVPVYLPATGAAGAPFGTLMGLPVQPVEQCSAVGDKGDIILGDFSQYQIIDKGSMQGDSSMHVYFQTAEEAFRFLYRVDGRPIKDSAVTAADGSGNTISPFVTLAERA